MSAPDNPINNSREEDGEFSPHMYKYTANTFSDPVLNPSIEEVEKAVKISYKKVRKRTLILDYQVSAFTPENHFRLSLGGLSVDKTDKGDVLIPSQYELCECKDAELWTYGKRAVWERHPPFEVPENSGCIFIRQRKPEGPPVSDEEEI